MHYIFTVAVTAFNLVITNSCSFPVVCNTLDKMKATINFFINSSKWESLLAEVAKKEGHPFRPRKVLNDVCWTR